MQIRDGKLPRARTGKELSREARTRPGLDGFLSSEQEGARTCRHFGISRQTFYRWQRRYDPQNLDHPERAFPPPSSSPPAHLVVPAGRSRSRLTARSEARRVGKEGR